MRAVPQLALSLLWLVALSARPSRVHADTGSRPALHWTRGPGAESCIDPARLSMRVEQLTGPVLARPAEASRSIEGQISALPQGGFRARLSVATADGKPAGERVLEHAARDCRSFDPALTFVIATLIDPALSLAALPPELLALVSGEVPADELLAQELAAYQSAQAHADLESPEELAPEAEEVGPEEEADAPSPPALPQRRYALGLLGVGEFSVLTEPMFGLGLHASYEGTGAWSLLASARGSANPTPAELDTQDFNITRGSALDFGLLLCADTEREPALRLRACLGPEYSLWLLEAFSFEGGNDRARLSGLGATLLLELRYRFGRAFSVVAFGALRFNLLTPSFRYDANSVAHQIPRISFMTGLGPSYAF